MKNSRQFVGLTVGYFKVHGEHLPFKNLNAGGQRSLVYIYV